MKHITQSYIRLEDCLEDLGHDSYNILDTEKILKIK